jgi:LPXTG-motif cell wall-anchored protein
MRSMRQRLAAMTMIGGLATLGLGLAAGPVSASSSPVDPNTAVTSCADYLGEAQSGSLHLGGTPAAGTVPTGSTVSLAASWAQGDFGDTQRMLICATVGGMFDASLSQIQTAVDNDGSLAHSASLPVSLPEGSDVCFLTALEGTLADQTGVDMVSETICYRVAATTTTTAAPVQPEVDPSVTEAGTTSAPAVEAAPVVGGEIAVNPAPAVELPRTGEGIDLLAGIGGIALALGGLARFTGRKRSAKR